MDISNLYYSNGTEMQLFTTMSLQFSQYKQYVIVV